MAEFGFSDVLNATPETAHQKVHIREKLQRQNGRQLDILEGDGFDAELFEHLLSVNEFEKVKRRFVVEAFSDLAVEVGNDEVDVVLGKRVETGPFRKELSEVEVIVFDMGLFPGGIRIAVIDSGSALLGCRAELKSGRIGELGTVVREDDGEHLSERVEAERPLKGVEHVDHGSGVVGRTQEREHKTAGVEVHREEDFLSGDADDAVHFDHGDIRICFQERKKVVEGTPDAALLIDLVLNGLGFPFLSSACHRQIVALRSDRPRLNQIVDCLFANRENILIGVHDVVDGLPLPCAVIYHVANPVELIFRHIDAFARFLECPSVAFLRDSGYIVILRQRTLPFTTAPVADIRRIDQSRTLLRGKHAAQFVA